MKPPILMTAPMLSRTSFDERFTVHKLWEGDREALLQSVGAEIRAVAGGGGAIDETLFARLPKLEIVANFGVGYDRVDVAAAAKRGIVVTNTPGVLDAEVADLALGLLLATVRRLPQADAYLRAGKWLSGAFPLTSSLQGRTVGIVGLGRIGKAIAQRCAAFGLPIAYTGRNPQPDQPYRYHASLIELAAAVDIMILVVPGGGATTRMIDRPVLEALGPDGILINVARGTVVDEPALIAALRDRRLGAAGLDVFEAEPKVPQALIELDNVVLLPHVGSASVATRKAMGELVLDNLTAWLAGGQPLTPVPETPVPARAG